MCTVLLPRRARPCTFALTNTAAHADVLGADWQHPDPGLGPSAVTDFVDSWITWRLHLVAALTHQCLLVPSCLADELRQPRRRRRRLTQELGVCKLRAASGSASVKRIADSAQQTFLAVSRQCRPGYICSTQPGANANAMVCTLCIPRTPWLAPPTYLAQPTASPGEHALLGRGDAASFSPLCTWPCPCPAMKPWQTS